MKTSDEMTEIVFRKMAIHELKMKERRRKILRTAVPLMLLLVVAAVSFGVWVSYNPEVINKTLEWHVAENDSMYPDRLWTDKPFAEAYIELSYDFSPNLKEMVEKSDLIVRGRFIKNYNNSLYDVKCINTPPSVIYGNIDYINTTSVLESFKVTDILKGDADKIISVLIKDVDVYNYGKFEFVATNPLYLHQKIGNEYLLFLDYNEFDDYYEFSTEPNTILISDNICYLHSYLKEDRETVFYFYLMKDDTITNDIIKITYGFNEPNKIKDTITGITIEQAIQQIKNHIKH